MPAAKPPRFYKKGSGKPSITWPESVDEALCCGWIDGIRKGIDASSYMIRFTPRRPGSTWSAVNIGRVAVLTRLPEPCAGILRGNRKAWDFFEAQPPGYRKLMSHWVASAKREETRLKRLGLLIEGCTRGRRL